MHIVLGATGHVGSAVAMALLDRGEAVTVVTRDARRAEPFTRRGAIAAVADVRDTDALRDAILRARADTAFLLMPPADTATDTVAEERRTVKAIAQAVAGAKSKYEATSTSGRANGAALRKVVVQSTYGAQPGDGIGDLSALYELEQAIAAAAIGRPVRISVVRGAYYMSNWDSALETARKDGVVHTFFPADFQLPMVAPADLGNVAARLLTDDVNHEGVRYVEGPMPQSATDVARAFSEALGREVRTMEIPRSERENAMRSFGFSPAAAASYARMMAVTLDRAERPEAPERGPTSLAEYIAALVRKSSQRHTAGAGSR